MGLLNQTPYRLIESDAITPGFERSMDIIMVKETYIAKDREINLSVTGGVITSVIKKNITRSACRVYENGHIGVAGKLGEADGELMAQALSNLSLQIPYEPDATRGSIRQEHMEQGSFSVEDSGGFLREVEEVLAILKKEYPQMLLSNKIRLSQSSRHLTNDAGTDLSFSDRVMGLELLVKHADSVNVFDDLLACTTRDFQREPFLREAREHLDAFLHPAVLPEGEMLPVIVTPMAVLSFLLENLDALAFGRGTSFFNGKLGQKLFNERFSLYVDKSLDTPGNPFFDVEGSTCPGDRCDLIREGVLLRPYSDKKLSREFGYDNTATAGGAYDSVPSNMGGSFAISSSGQTLKELIGERDGIYISVISGGDFTSEGNFASPVQTAFLYRNGKLVGRLPEFGISGNLYDLFGKDFIGLSADRAYEGEFKLALNMKIAR